MIEGYKTKDVKTSKTKAKAVEKEEGVIFQEGDLWCFKWGNGQENFTTKEFAETALARLQGVEQYRRSFEKSS